MIDKETEKIICDRLEGWELVEFLQIPIEDVCRAFKDEIEEAIEDVQEWCGIRGFDDYDREE